MSPVRLTRNKYNATRTVVDGITFDSKKEAARYQELRLLEKAGQIHGLSLQPVFELVVLGIKIGTYRSDFFYCECPHTDGWCCGPQVYEDAKGVRTSLYRWKKKHVEAQYGITITEI